MLKLLAVCGSWNALWAILLLLFLTADRSTALGQTANTVADAPPAPSFTRDVRPILSRYCFKCHGPDDGARQAGMRLDLREAATKPVESGNTPIVPGKPDESALVARIFAESEDERMPPLATKMTLGEREKQILKQWIASGAKYEQHWAFVRPRQAPLPQVKHAAWPQHSIDYFVLAEMEKQGLSPSRPADRHTLIRRVSLDLVGLPPTPEEVEVFVSDKSPDVYERLVERLLASPHYGERWARKWLDLARYADTNGYEKDRPRSIWPYRDWVIQAINGDLPFDEFTIQQIAGDMLPDAKQEQLIATGFHRNTMLNEEGGIDPLEFRFHAMTDRLATTGITWLGLTVGCAQCHTHKFDPIPHREYYQLMALLNNADEPEIDLPQPEIDLRRKEIEAKIAQFVAGLEKRFPPGNGEQESLEAKFSAWLDQQRQRTVSWTMLRPTSAKSNLPLLTVQEDDSVFVSGDMSKSDTYELAFRTGLRGISALRLDMLPDERLPKHGPGRVYYEGPKGDFFLSEMTVLIDGQKVSIAKASHSFASDKTSAAFAIDGDQQSGWAINGGQGRAHTAVFNLKEPLPTGEFTVQLLFEKYYAAGVGKFRLSATADNDAEARDLPEAAEKLLSVPDAELTKEQRDALRREFLLRTPELADARKEIDDLKTLIPQYPTTLVMQERPPENPRPTFIHKRGEFLQPVEQVAPATLSVLHPLPAGAPRNRLMFAKWLVAAENPLTPRVIVNRHWAAFFGRGLVRTTEDFGYQGEPPTHGELLDWLAVEFVRQGWSLKRLHQMIVTSATYQQSSRVTEELLSRDSENKFLARGPRGRLEAEQIRDAALRASGLLTARLGGPSVFPPQPASVTTEGAYGRLEWKASDGGDRYRRSLYTYAKRTTPFAMHSTFDAPSGEACEARRDVSNTPLQALTLLNDVMFTEAAQALGRQFAARDGSVEERLDALFRRCLSRPPAAEELSALGEFLARQKQRLEAEELNAATIAGNGPGDASERAAWTVLARVIFNLDEFVSKR